MALLVWIYVIEAVTWYIRPNKIDNIFQAVCIGIMGLLILIGLRSAKGIQIQKAFLIYIFLLLSAILPDMIYGREQIGFRTMIMYALPLIMYLYVYNYHYNKTYVKSSLLIIPVVYGLIVSIHMILYEAGSLLGFTVEKSYAYIDKTGNHVVLASVLGIPMGQYGEFGNIAGRNIMRAWGYFIEPSKLAVFLLISIFFAFGIYKQTGKKAYNIIAVICFICFILTMSRAGYVAFAGAVIFSKILKKKRSLATDSNEVTSSRDLSKILVFVPVFLAIAVIGLSAMVLLGQYFPNLDFLYKGITDAQTGQATLMRSSTVNSDLLINLFAERPWGWGFSNTLHNVDKLMPDTNLANAFTLWFIAGGVIGASLAVTLVFFLIKNYAIPCIKSTNYIKNAVGMAFIGYTIHGLSYGTWMTPDYLAVASIMAVIYNRDIKWKNRNLNTD